MALKMAKLQKIINKFADKSWAKCAVKIWNNDSKIIKEKILAKW